MRVSYLRTQGSNLVNESLFCNHEMYAAERQSYLLLLELKCIRAAKAVKQIPPCVESCQQHEGIVVDAVPQILDNVGTAQLGQQLDLCQQNGLCYLSSPICHFHSHAVPP